MPVIQPQGLKGLPGLNRLSYQERQDFFANNKSKLQPFINNPQAYEYAASVLYDNQQFKNRFGDEGFNTAKTNGLSYAQRNQLLTSAIAQDAFKARFSPWDEDESERDNHKGLGADYEKYFGYIDPVTKQRIGGMSDEGLIKAVESDYLTPQEFETKWKKAQEVALDIDNKTAFIRPAGSTMYNHPMSTETYGEAAKQSAWERNNRILEHIYNDESDKRANDLGDTVAQVYAQADPKIVGGSDEETVALFKKAITPDYANGNMGIPEYASHYGIIDGEGISSEMKDFTVDDMRQVLAKKAVYDAYMSPEMAKTALDNEAKRYIHDHQGFAKQAAVFVNDVAIAATSYTIDKVNGFYNIGLMAADAMGDKPVVWVDTNGQVIDTTNNKLMKNQDGNVFYVDENGNRVGVHQERIDRTTLHNMGKNFDGTDDESFLNPQDWTRKEQFGVWSSDLAKQYERLGSSPYKIAYNPNDDRDLLYESFKMMSFGLADVAVQLIPFGIGAAGKALSNANNVGRVVRGIGSVANKTGKFILQNPLGQGAQGIAGAFGIAEAYQRGAFQETYAKNMADLEQTVADRSMNEIRNQYNNDKEYKKQIDALAEAKFVDKKANYMANLGPEGQSRIVDEQALDEELKEAAKREVIAEAINDRISEYKSSDGYATMQEEAINSAGLAATNSFWPEALKYSLVNTFGYRKYFYKNPTALIQRTARNFGNGLKEITTSAGRKRLVTTAKETLTNGEKWASVGKKAANIGFQGAWTNGTDDMMVDAAERINEDSFGRYLHQYENGEALADTYGFADGMFSYWMGLQNSMGQQTTREAATVGFLGSLLSSNIHFSNIASLFTKEGKEAFKQNFQQRYERDDDGMIMRDEQGNPIIKELSWKDNWRDRAAFFIQNGVLNEYYGAKQNQRDMQRHADFVNELLDQQDDFNAIRDLVASDIGTDNAENIGDKKTMRFVQAFNAINTLNRLGNDEKDPTTLSSVVQDRKTLIDRASKLGTNEEHDFTPEELSNLVAQYYSNNAIPQSDQNDEIAIQHIGQNARKLKEASEAYNKAEANIQSLEEEMGASIMPAVRFKMKLSQALDSHWKERVQTMKDEIGDTSGTTETPIGENLIATFGGKKKSDSQMKYYEAQELVLTQKAADATNEVQKKLDIYNKAQEALRKAENSEQTLQAQKDLKEAKNAYEDAVEEKMYQEDMLSAIKDKKSQLQEALDAWEKGDKSKVLSADEIFYLDPVTRARMMLPENRKFYSSKQQKQIEKLESRLKMEYPQGNPLQKIQDIALLTQRIAQNEDAYNRISRNPDAAAVQLEKQQQQEAESAVKHINFKNANTLADYITQMELAVKGRKDIKQKDIDEYVYKTLRYYNPTLLDIIDNQQLLPNYSQQVADAKAWSKVLSDIDTIVSQSDQTPEQKEEIGKAIDGIVEPASSKEEIISRLEQAIDNGHPQAEIFDKILSDMTNLGYTRDSVVLEKRKERKERQEAIAAKIKEESAKAEAEAKAAAEKKAQEGEVKASKEEQQKAVEEGEEVALNFEEEKEEEYFCPVCGKKLDKNYKQHEMTCPQCGSDLSIYKQIEELSEEEAEELAKELGIQNKSTESSVNDNVKQGHDDSIGDYVEGHSATAAEEKLAADDAVVSNEAVNTDVINDNVERANETEPTTLSGNAMAEYDAAALREHRLEHKKGEKSDDPMNQYYEWMKNAGVKLQNIIDDELPKILAVNPHTKIKFMRTRPTPNATHDEALKNTLLLVADYDNSINKGITSIHNQDNGGVVESNGKKYLIVGTLGYGDNGLQSERGKLWQSLNNAYQGHKLPAVAWTWFKQPGHEVERFYVHEGFSTEIVPGSMIPGWIIRENETDEYPQSRKISELLADKERNPHGLTMKSLGWSIIEYTQSVDINTKGKEVMHPQNQDANAGRVFVLIPAGNGKLLAAKIDSLYFNDEKFNRESALYQELQQLFTQLAAPQYKDRYDALVQLMQKLYITPEGHTILLAKDANGITFKRGNTKVRTVYTAAPNFNMQELFDAIAEWNPRINITARVLSNPKELQKYDEAGALMTDLAKLGTSGVNYSVYAIDVNGDMIKPIEVNPTVNKAASNSEYRDANRQDVHYLYGELYHYDVDAGTYTKNGVVVTDAETIKGLDYAKRIIGQSPAKTEGVWDYYVLSEGEKAEVIKQSNKTKKIEEVQGEEAQKLIQEVEEQKAAAAREAAIQAKLEEDKKDTSSAVVDEETGEITVVEQDEGKESKSNDVEAFKEAIIEATIKFYKDNNIELRPESINGMRQTSASQIMLNPNVANIRDMQAIQDVLNRFEKPIAPVKPVSQQEGTQNFSQAVRNKTSRTKIMDAIKDKVSKDNTWSDAPMKSPKQLEEYLRKKGVQLDMIPTDDVGLEAWIHNNIVCK